MRPIGYLYKRVAAAPEWLKAPHVSDIYSLSGCVSEAVGSHLEPWRQNGYGLFDSPAHIHALAAEHGLSLAGARLFYYEAYELEYDGQWTPFEPNPALDTAVVPCQHATLEGFDVATYWLRSGTECSPLSCNGLAAELPTNTHCLFPSLEAAIQAVEQGRFEHSEPGPYRVIAVYSV